jgi:hypothetical protein
MYKKFWDKEDGVIKVMLGPGMWQRLSRRTAPEPGSSVIAAVTL